MFAVRQTEGWTAGSVLAGIVLAALAIGALAWALERASRR